MLLINLTGWALLIASWTLPQKLFEDEDIKFEAKMFLSVMALVIFTHGLLKIVLGS